MAVMRWMSARPVCLDNEGYEWVEARFIFLLLVIAEEEYNSVFFGTNF